MTLVGRWGQILVSSNISENWDLTPAFFRGVYLNGRNNWGLSPTI